MLIGNLVYARLCHALSMLPSLMPPLARRSPSHQAAGATIDTPKCK